MTDKNQTEILQRNSCKELDKILGKTFNVLNDGKVRLIDYMGDDSAIVQAARVSYGKGTKKVHQDRGLIRYLMRHQHTTPFEMCEIKLHVRVPMDHWRQWIRHRTASVNEYSTRYSEAINSIEKTLPGEWRFQSKSNKQGSSEFVDIENGKILSEKEKELHDLSREVYEDRLSKGVAREQARKDLPLSQYTEAYWKIDLHNLLHFLALRMDSHAQLEIRSYANVIGNEIVAKWVPMVWEAFNDYHFRRNATVLTRLDREIICAINESKLNTTFSVVKKAEEFGWIKFNDKGKLKNNRERKECEQKLLQLGFEIPWQEKINLLKLGLNK